RGHVHEIVEIRLELEVFDDRDDRIRLDHHKTLPQISGRFGDCAGEVFFEVAAEVALPWGRRHGCRGLGGSCMGRGFRRGRFGSVSSGFRRWDRGLAPTGRRRVGTPRLLLVSHLVPLRDSYTYHLRARVSNCVTRHTKQPWITQPSIASV